MKFTNKALNQLKKKMEWT